MKDVKTFYSTSKNAASIALEFKNQVADFRAELILFFVSSNLDVAAINNELNKTFKETKICGCTTSGEIVSGKMLDNAFVAMAFGKDLIADMAIELVDLNDGKEGIKRAFENFGSHFKNPMASLDPEKYVGIVLIDGMSGAEEMVNDKIGDLTNITFIGGSAGDDLKFKETKVFYEGKIFDNAALLMVLKPTVPFSILKTQSFKSTGKVLKVTRSDEKQRKIYEFNGKPARKAYAEALNIAPEKLEEYLFKNPVGLMFNDEPFVRSPRVMDGDSIYFYCSVKDGMELHLLSSTNIVEDTKNALKKKKEEMGNIGSIINFNCILRTLDLKQQQATQAYADLFKELPTVGFSTYGESYIGHINQTATMLVFGKS